MFSMATRSALDELFSPERVTHFVYYYAVPAMVVLGWVGNCLNLLVLLHRKMRYSKTNLLFALMALADMACLTMMGLTSAVRLLLTREQQQIYTRNYTHIVNALTNWFSAMSIWFMIYATFERVTIIKFPFMHTAKAVTARFLATVSLIGVVSLTVVGIHFHTAEARQRLGSLHKAWITLHSLSVIAIPFAVVTMLNLIIIIELRRNRFQMQALPDNNSICNKKVSYCRSSHEKKVTTMVIVISTAFLICNMPGCVLYIVKTFDLITIGRRLPAFEAIANTLTIMGKVLNFALFCFSSANFRRLSMQRLSTFFFCKPFLAVTTRRGSSRFGHSAANKTLSLPLTDL